MKYPFTHYATILSVCITLLCLTLSPAYAQDNSSTQTNNGLNGYVNLPTAALAVDEKSRIGAGLTGVGNGNEIRKLHEELQQYIQARKREADNAFYIDFLSKKGKQIANTDSDPD